MLLLQQKTLHTTCLEPDLEQYQVVKLPEWKLKQRWQVCRSGFVFLDSNRYTDTSYLVTSWITIPQLGGGLKVSSLIVEISGTSKWQR